MPTAAEMNRTNPLLSDPATDSNLEWDGQQDLPLDENADAQADATGNTDQQTDVAEAQADAAAEQIKQAETKTDKPPEGYVPHGAFHEERRRRQTLEAEIKAMNDRFGQVLDSVGKLRVQPEAPSKATNYDDDPLAFLKSELETTRTKIAELEHDKQSRVRASEETSRQQQFYRTVASQVAAYKRERPDYDQAFQFMQQKRMDDLTALGVAPDQAAMVLDAEAQWLAGTALEQGKNPGEAVYTMAQRWGYKPDAKASGEAERLKQIEQNQAKAKSLANAGGTPTLQDLSRLGDDEFESALKELGLK